MKKLNIHFVGIKGVGMTPLAIIAHEAGFGVTGSDIGDEFITDAALKKAGIEPIVGFSADNIINPDLVIITGAHGGYDNIEAANAKEKGIEVITQGEAVGIFMTGELFKNDWIGVSVAGTHGKTTTSAMIATVLRENKLDPSFVIGTGNVGSLGAPGHFGNGKHFIAEADEYATEPHYNKKPKLLWQFPKIAVITNIEFDHPDIFESIDDVRSTFLAFCNQLPKNALVVACGDDPEIKKMLMEYAGQVIRYGFNHDNDYILEKVRIDGEYMFFRVSSKGMILADLMLKVVGEHNALNALSAIVVSLELGLSIDKIKSGLLAFQGSKRRLEYIGELQSGAFVYDDY
ncbi:MAG TPA: Mur ligase family protein, partial [Candidatus Saccharimonadales bacterium]|nr:Mur ligase family protein [Candidatus Saccharimonadales bacterium]